MVRLTDRPDMTLDVYRGRKTTIQQQLQSSYCTIHYLLSMKLEVLTMKCKVQNVK